jgi:glycosyltransferase involved in cell wall biosynthesis
VVNTLVLHDYLTQRGGAERVALLMAQDLGGGAITTSAFRPAETFPEFGALDVHEILPVVPGRTPSRRLAMAPLAAVSFGAHRARADVVLCSSSGWSHWTSTPSPTVVYCHTPPRWFWAPQDFFHGHAAPVRAAASRAVAVGRSLDRSRARRATTYVANSSVVRRRIQQAYGIDAEVVHPPVSFAVDGPVEPYPGLEPGFVLTIARDRSYKNVATSRRVFGAGGLGRLVVVGEGVPQAGNGENVVNAGRITDAQLRWLYRSCRAVLALSHEDFGLTPVEGHAFGKPTVALRAGGYLDTCEEGVNAVFTDDLEDASVRRAVRSLDTAGLQEATVLRAAERFSRSAFTGALSRVLAEAARSG